MDSLCYSLPEKVIEELQTRERNRIYAYSGGGIVVVLGGISLFWLLARKKREKNEKDEEV
jgi:hypothetical protein